MSVSFNATARRRTAFKAPANTTAVSFDAVDEITTLESLVICATTSGAAASVWINDGTTDWPLLDAKAIAANTTETYDFGNPVLEKTWALKVKDGTGAKLTFTATFATQTRQGG
jgi:hypothetical protein